jgi:hypothetical protein
VDARLRDGAVVADARAELASHARRAIELRDGHAHVAARRQCRLLERRERDRDVARVDAGNVRVVNPIKKPSLPGKVLAARAIDVPHYRPVASIVELSAAVIRVQIDEAHRVARLVVPPQVLPVIKVSATRHAVVESLATCVKALTGHRAEGGPVRQTVAFVQVAAAHSMQPSVNLPTFLDRLRSTQVPENVRALLAGSARTTPSSWPFAVTVHRPGCRCLGRGREPVPRFQVVPASITMRTGGGLKEHRPAGAPFSCVAGPQVFIGGGDGNPRVLDESFLAEAALSVELEAVAGLSATPAPCCHSTIRGAQGALAIVGHPATLLALAATAWREVGGRDCADGVLVAPLGPRLVAAGRARPDGPHKLALAPLGIVAAAGRPGKLGEPFEAGTQADAWEVGSAAGGFLSAAWQWPVQQGGQGNPALWSPDVHWGATGEGTSVLLEACRTSEGGVVDMPRRSRAVGEASFDCALRHAAGSLAVDLRSVFPAGQGTPIGTRGMLLGFVFELTGVCVVPDGDALDATYVVTAWGAGQEPPPAALTGRRPEGIYAPVQNALGAGSGGGATSRTQRLSGENTSFEQHRMVPGPIPPFVGAAPRAMEGAPQRKRLVLAPRTVGTPVGGFAQ